MAASRLVERVINWIREKLKLRVSEKEDVKFECGKKVLIYHTCQGKKKTDRKESYGG